MKKITKLNFEIVIHSSVEKVWEKMLGDQGYRIWTKAFNSAGSWYEGSLTKGSGIKFLGPNENGSIGGLASKVAEVRENEFISFRHLGLVMDGKEVFDTPEVLSWAPSYENYTFTNLGDKTKLEVYLEVADEWKSMMEGMWPKALQKLKEVCE